MKKPASFLTAALMTVGHLTAAEGVSPEWTQVSAADQTLMGDYEGEWLDAPKGHYFQINPPLAAQVINVSAGEYLLRFYQEHDRRADAYFEGPGKLEGDVIRFSGKGWSGAVSTDGISGSGSGHGGGAGVRFQLKRVIRSSPTLGAKPPQGAIILFDGGDFDHWEHTDGKPVIWHLPGNGAMEVRVRSDGEKKKGIGGNIRTREKFGDCRVHLEFRYPVEPGKAGQARGNSGFFLQGEYELQVLNSYGLEGRWNECGALYKTSPPRVNAARPPMEWQTYDIDYTASVWMDGKKISPPRITVRHNGVLVHNDEEIPHATAHSFLTRNDEPRGDGPLVLQDHNNALQYRNIWVVPAKKD
jgi:hypothetical protein